MRADARLALDPLPPDRARGRSRGPDTRVPHGETTTARVQKRGRAPSVSERIEVRRSERAEPRVIPPDPPAPRDGRRRARRGCLASRGGPRHSLATRAGLARALARDRARGGDGTRVSATRPAGTTRRPAATRAPEEAGLRVGWHGLQHVEPVRRDLAVPPLVVVLHEHRAASVAAAARRAFGAHREPHRVVRGAAAGGGARARRRRLLVGRRR